jgi:hypothetical protein
LYDIGLALFAQLLLIPDALDKLDALFPVIKQLRDFDARSYDSLLISHLRSAIPTSSACFIDARVPGIDTLKLRKPALGDVDYHPHPDFIDVGRVRQWCLDCPASEIAGD